MQNYVYLFKYSINISLQMFLLLLCEGKLLSASKLIKFRKSNKDIYIFSFLLAKITQYFEVFVLFSWIAVKRCSWRYLDICIYIYIYISLSVRREKCLLLLFVNKTPNLLDDTVLTSKGKRFAATTLATTNETFVWTQRVWTAKNYNG